MWIYLPSAVRRRCSHASLTRGHGSALLEGTCSCCGAGHVWCPSALAVSCCLVLLTRGLGCGSFLVSWAYVNEWVIYVIMIYYQQTLCLVWRVGCGVVSPRRQQANWRPEETMPCQWHCLRYSAAIRVKTDSLYWYSRGRNSISGQQDFSPPSSH